MTKSIFLTVQMLFIIHYQLFAQKSLEEYIQQGLTTNLVLKDKNIQLQKAQIALKEAKSNYLPQVGFTGTYTYGAGGRRIDLPVGDLLNNVYSTLNQLTASESFPQIENVSEELNPYNFYDVKIGTQMPIYNPDIGYNQRIKQKQIQLSEQEILVYKRDLVRDIKQAYYNYLMSAEAIKIYQNALKLVAKNVQINESLLKNGSGLPANVLRAKSEQDNLKAQLENAQGSEKNARAYFNFLINAPLEQEVTVSYMEKNQLDSIVNQPDVNISGREELNMIQTAIAINQQVVDMQKSYAIPRLNAFVDIGSQAFEFAVNNQTPYIFGGFQIQFPIFQGFQNKYKIQQATLDKQLQVNALTHTQNQLQLGATIAKNKIQQAYASYLATQKQVASAQSYYNLIERGFELGANSQIELIDAQNQLNMVSLQRNIARFQIYIEAVDLERQIAGFQF